MKRRYFIHFDITKTCMQEGIRNNEDNTKRDVFDNLAHILRNNANVREMVESIQTGEVDKICIGVGREYPE